MNARKRVLAMFVISAGVRAAAAAPVDYLAPDEESGASRAVVIEGCALAHTGQLLPLDKQGALVGEGSVDTQLAHLLFNLETALAAAGSGIDHLAKLNMYVDSDRTANAVRRMFAKRFRKPVLPAMSWVCTPLPHPKALVAADAVAVVPRNAGTEVLRRRCEALAGSPRLADVAILPRGQAVYVAGIPAKGDTAAAAAKSLQSLVQTITHLGLDRRHVVQLKAFLPAMSDAELVKQQVCKVFGEELAPPVVLVEWASKESVEIEMIAYAPPGKSTAPTPETAFYFTPPGVKASPVYSRVAVARTDKRIYISGLYADAPGDGQAQVRSIFSALQETVKQAGSDMQHLVKATYYVSDEDASSMLNKLRPDYYNPQRPPAASKAMVKGVGIPNRSVTMDMIAVNPQ